MGARALSPHLEEGVHIWGRMLYPMKACAIAQIFSVQSETLSLSIYEQNSLQIYVLGT